MNAQEKAFLDLKRPVIAANSSKTGEEKLQSEISECNSHSFTCNAVPIGLREIRNHNQGRHPFACGRLQSRSCNYLVWRRPMSVLFCSLQTAFNIRLRILIILDDV
jgi:hypothetical protein